MRTLLSALGSPQADLPVAHIAGTKGKGSVTAMLQSILQESGYRVGTYTRHACTHHVRGVGAVHSALQPRPCSQCPPHAAVADKHLLAVTQIAYQ